MRSGDAVATMRSSNNLRLMRLTVGLGVWLLLSAQAALALDIDGAADVAGIARFPHSDIVRYVRYPAGQSFAYPLSDVDKLRGELRGRRVLRLAGARTSITYRINPGYGADEVMQFFEHQFPYRGADRYSCRGLDCGPSTLWANDVFGIATLYGSETSQAYLATSVPLAGVPSRVAVYVVERANHQLFAQLEVIDEVSITPTIRSTASASVAGERWRALSLTTSAGEAPAAADLKRVRSVLRDARATEALVICYLDAPMSAAVLLAKSNRCAAQVVTALQVVLPGVQLWPVGAGADGRSARVEVVYRVNDH